MQIVFSRNQYPSSLCINFDGIMINAFFSGMEMEYISGSGCYSPERSRMEVVFPVPDTRSIGRK
jgi:hypothetical protein